MNKILLVPDSFKGTMSSQQICNIMKESIHRYYPKAQVIAIPVADGGEGSVDCFLHAAGDKRVQLRVQGPLMEEMDCYYGVLEDGSTAVVEMASCAGLPLIEDCKNPLMATTYGVGEQILHAARNGAKKIIVGLGGSATNDGGCGAAAAVGIAFLDAQGNSFVPTGGTLCKIERIDFSKRNGALDDVKIIAMCDIDNPMYGLQGAAHVFAPQKGADEAMVKELDDGLRHLAEVIKRDLGLDLAQTPGTGAAGAMGAGMLAFFDAKLQMGIETVLDTVSFGELLQGADMVFTGEGRIDGQSLRGKVVIGVARRAREQNVPVIAIVGDIQDPIDGAYDQGVSAIFSINRVARDFAAVRHLSPDYLRATMDNLMRFYTGLQKT